MKQDRFLTGILIGIGVLVLLALGLFFLRQDKREYVSDAAPDGVVHNYVLALLDHDYEKAYGYLADLDRKPTYEEFRQSFFNGMVNYDNVGLDVGDVQINGNEAIVNLTVYYSYNDPFSSRNGTSDRALLVEQDGSWKLSTMPYNFWDYNWYQEPYKP
ncbi:MAG TPA: hypothetical protein PKL78_02745 [Anaerolineales bacterium]|nr:hypothetical protein [Anaerolineales bacterium]HNN12447.1 hypothetical protein [Anaerolineales bacterium]HNO30491.1 hypothetical protein [Anaerolineales bacterium]